MDNEQLVDFISKSAIATGTGGQLSTQQSKQFFDAVVDQNNIFSKIQTVNMTAGTYQLNAMGLSSRQIRKATEGSSTVNITGSVVTITPRTLTAVEVILPYDITLNFIEENIANGAAEGLITNVFSKQFSNDLYDLATNGTGSANNFLGITDGWFATAKADTTAHAYTIPTGSLTYKTEMSNMLALLPNQWKANPAELVFMVSPDWEQGYRDELGARNTALGDSMIAERRATQFNGIDVLANPYMPSVSGTTPRVILTKYNNLAVGIGRDMRVDKFFNARARTVEYTITGKIAFNHVVGDMIVYGERA